MTRRACERALTIHYKPYWTPYLGRGVRAASIECGRISECSASVAGNKALSGIAKGSSGASC